MIEFLFFDLDDTILDFHRAERGALSRAFADVGIEPTDALMDRYHYYNIKHWEMLERGEIARSQVLTGRFQMLFDELGMDVSPDVILPIYENYLGMGHYFMDGAQGLLDRLRGKYRMFIASNGTLSVQKSRIASADLAKYMENIFVSEKLGANKPSAEFFERSFAQIPDFDRGRAVIIGDSLTSDILGGIRAGIRTIWYNPRNKENRSDIHPDFEIESLNQVDELLINIKNNNK